MSEAATKAKAEADKFYALVGRCITIWAHVETHLFRSFVTALEAPRHKAAVVFRRSPTMDSRLKLTSEVVEFALPSRQSNGGKTHPLMRKWQTLLARLNELMPVRNQIAHDPVEYWSGPVELDAWGENVMDFTWLNYKTKEFSKEAHDSTLIIDDLENHLKWVGELEAQIKQFRDELAAHVLERTLQEQTPARPDNL